MNAARCISLVTLVILLAGYGCRSDPKGQRSSSSDGGALFGVWAGQVTQHDAAGLGTAGAASRVPAASGSPSSGQGIPLVWTFLPGGSYRSRVYWDQNYVLEMGGAYILEDNRLKLYPLSAVEGTYRNPPDASSSGPMVASIHASWERAKAGKESWIDEPSSSTYTWAITGESLTLTDAEQVMKLTRKPTGYVPEATLIPSMASALANSAPDSTSQSAPPSAPNSLQGDKSDVLIGKWVGEDTLSNPPLSYTYTFDARGQYQMTVSRAGQQETRSGVYRLTDGVLYLDQKACRTIITGDTLRIGEIGTAITLTHQR